MRTSKIEGQTYSPVIDHTLHFWESNVRQRIREIAPAQDEVLDMMDVEQSEVDHSADEFGAGTA